MPVKDGDKVYFKIASGAIKMGKYDAKTKMVMMSGGKKAKPPKKALHHTRKGAMDGAFVKLKGSSDVLGAPKKYPSKNAKEKPTPTKKVSTKKPRRKTYYAGYDRFGGEEEELILSDGWKMDSSYGDFNVYKRSMASLSEDSLEFWENAPYRTISKRLTYGNRQDNKKENANEKPTPTKASMNKMIVIKVRNYGRGVNKSELNGFRKLSQKEVFGAKSKAQPGNLGNEYYLKEVKSESDKKELTDLSMGYPKEIQFFSISSLNKKFGTMGEKTISHSSIRKGDY